MWELLRILEGPSQTNSLFRVRWRCDGQRQSRTKFGEQDRNFRILVPRPPGVGEWVLVAWLLRSNQGFGFRQMRAGGGILAGGGSQATDEMIDRMNGLSGSFECCFHAGKVAAPQANQRQAAIAPWEQRVGLICGLVRSLKFGWFPAFRLGIQPGGPGESR